MLVICDVCLGVKESIKHSFEDFWQNLKMKVSHPRFLKIGEKDVMQMKFPSCLEKTGSAADGHVPTKTYKASQSVYSFPEDMLICGDSPFLWPLYLRAAAPGNLSLYIIIYYEVGYASSIMRYRVLRMHYNLEVLLSLDVSFQISPHPSRLQEFLVRMDVINRTSSESFQNCRKWVNAEDDPSSLVPSEKADIRLVHGNGEALFDTFRSPLVDFPHSGRVHQGTSDQCCKLKSWLIEGPGTVRHNFAVDFCEIKLKMTIHNSSDVTASVHFSTFDSALNFNSLSTGASVSSANEAEWRDLSVLNDVKVTSDVIPSRSGKLLSSVPVPPFIWSSSSSNRVTLEPMSSPEIPLQICVLSWDI